MTTAVTVTFSEPVDPASVNAVSLTIGDDGVRLAANVWVEGDTVFLVPTAPLSPSRRYTVTLTTAVKDLDGGALAERYQWSFTTTAAPDTTPPSVFLTSPLPNTSGVWIWPTVTVRFNEELDPRTISSETFVLSSAGGQISGVLTVERDTVTFKASSPLGFGALHSVSMRRR